jgi:hypothetical protein
MACSGRFESSILLVVASVCSRTCIPYCIKRQTLSASGVRALPVCEQEAWIEKLVENRRNRSGPVNRFLVNRSRNLNSFKKYIIFEIKNH